MPAVSTQEGLLAELPRPAGRVLFAGAEGARSLLADELARGRGRPLPDQAGRPAEIEGDLAVVASPSAAALSRAAQSGAAGRLDRPGDDGGRAGRGLRVAAEAETPDVEGLVAAVAASE